MFMATRVKHWTLDEVHSLPDDGNKYELIHGELFVTPAPSTDHETILARLTRLLVPYVERHHLGLVYHPRAVVRVQGSETEPDLMVRQPPPVRLKNEWENMPMPILVVEVLSSFTRRRDHMQKRQWHREIGVSEYWIVDPEGRRSPSSNQTRTTTSRATRCGGTLQAPVELKISRIGNSRGVRLPAATLERYQIGESLMMEERSDGGDDSSGGDGEPRRAQ